MEESINKSSERPDLMKSSNEIAVKKNKFKILWICPKVREI